MIRKNKDMMNEPKKTAEMGIGMDLEVDENIKYMGSKSIKEVKRLDERKKMRWHEK
jgi:hypothetical protein